MFEDEVVSRVCNALAKCGIPKNVIFREQRVDVGRHQRFDVDLLVAAEDQNLPLYLFEVKLNGLRNEILRDACHRFGSISSILPCFVVVVEHGKVLVSRIGRRGCSVWVDLSDERCLARLLGNYSAESQRVIDLCQPESSELQRQDLKKFRDGLTGGATVVLLILFLVEIGVGKAVSYQFAGLVALVLVLYAASYGVVKELKFKGMELSFCHQVGKRVLS